MNVIFDASVLLKTVLPKENETEKAVALFEQYSQGIIEVYEPSFWVYEIGNTLSRKLPLRKAQIGFEFLLAQKFRTFHFTNKQLLEINKFSNQNKVSFYDASYHLLAHFTNSLFITADKKYFQKFKEDKSIALLENF